MRLKPTNSSKTERLLEPPRDLQRDTMSSPTRLTAQAERDASLELARLAILVFLSTRRPGETS